MVGVFGVVAEVIIVTVILHKLGPPAVEAHNDLATLVDLLDVVHESVQGREVLMVQVAAVDLCRPPVACMGLKWPPAQLPRKVAGRSGDNSADANGTGRAILGTTRGPRPAP